MKKISIIVIITLVIICITIAVHPWTTDEWCEDKILNHPGYLGYDYLVLGDWDGITRTFNVYACNPEREIHCMIYPAFYHGQIDIFGNVEWS